MPATFISGCLTSNSNAGLSEDEGLCKYTPTAKDMESFLGLSACQGVTVNLGTLHGNGSGPKKGPTLCP